MEIPIGTSDGAVLEIRPNVETHVIDGLYFTEGCQNPLPVQPRYAASNEDRFGIFFVGQRNNGEFGLLATAATADQALKLADDLCAEFQNEDEEFLKENIEK